MLIIDDNMFKLAKMQETLLKLSVENRQTNLDKYKETVVKIDEEVFASLLDELGHINEHNRTLEDELQFLEQIRNCYEQLYELQLSFKRVCEIYGSELQLSDLLEVNIEYIENRISVINGYLINKKNIVNNKERLQKLNEELISEEKNNEALKRKMLEYECLLRDSFNNAEGRMIVDGQLHYISVLSEYKKLGYDLKLLLENEEELNKKLQFINNEKKDIEEKLGIAKVCYDTNPNSDSKQIYDEINKEFLIIKYKLTMLKILYLLSINYDDYDLFIDKREKLLDLIKYRNICLKSLNIHLSIDPFSRTKISEQLDMISSIKDNSSLIGKIKKEIAELSERVDEAIVQNTEYMIKINETQDLIVSRVGISDIDVSNVSLDSENVIEFYEDEKIILDNQVVNVRDKSSVLNMNIVNGKTSNVIKRVNEMVSSLKTLEKKEDVLIPELVIVPQPVNNSINEEYVSDDLGIKQKEEENVLISNLEDVEDDKPEHKSTLIFENVQPFIETPLFSDKIDDVDHNIELDDSKIIDSLNTNVDLIDEEENDFFISNEVIKDNDEENSDELSIIEDNNEININLLPNVEEINVDSWGSLPEVEEMPDVFWITQEDEISDNDFDDVVLSFDEQIDALLSSEDDNKIKKLVA